MNDRFIKKQIWLQFFLFLCTAVATVFNISDAENKTARIYDNIDTEILNADIFDKILRKFCHSGSFYLKVQFEGSTQNSTLLPVTKEVSIINFESSWLSNWQTKCSLRLCCCFSPSTFIFGFCLFVQILRAFLIENGGARMVNEFNYEGKLCKKSRQKLCDFLCDFLFQKFGLYPTREQKAAVSKAAIQLFPVLRVPNSKLDGIVSTIFIIILMDFHFKSIYIFDTGVPWFINFIVFSIYYVNSYF